MTKNQAISAALLKLIEDGKDLAEAWNEVLGDSVSFEEFAGNLYDTLNANN